MKTYQVTAKRWERGWELHIESVGVTQSRTVKDAEAMIRDYLHLEGNTEPYELKTEFRGGEADVDHYVAPSGEACPHCPQDASSRVTAHVALSYQRTMPVLMCRLHETDKEHEGVTTWAGRHGPPSPSTTTQC